MILNFCSFSSPLTLAALMESSPDLEGAMVMFINGKLTQNSLGLADGAQSASLKGSFAS